MLVDLFHVWGQKAVDLILILFEYIFPEYPKIGLAVFAAAGIFFVYYLARGKAGSAVKMALSTLVTLIVVVYVIHLLIKLYRIAI